MIQRTAEYRAWQGMRNRCKNPTHRQFASYGGRGISVCLRWDSYATFLEDMGPRPDGHSLERIDNQGNYEPGNCKWATRVDQNNNRRNNRMVEYRGDQMPLGAAIRLAGSVIPYGNVHGRLERGWDLERALSEPILRGAELHQMKKIWDLSAAVKVNGGKRLRINIP